jgi:disulfide bond formation protein DsbB
MTRKKNALFNLVHYSLYFAWLISLLSSLSSLYFSEILGFIPCTLCWFQRIFMYPLVFLLGMASYRNDKAIIPYLFPLTFIGAGVALFHLLEQKIPGLASVVPCKIGAPCHLDYLNLWGFVTIPLLSFLAFSFITFFIWMAWKKDISWK